MADSPPPPGLPTSYSENPTPDEGPSQEVPGSSEGFRRQSSRGMHLQFADGRGSRSPTPSSTSRSTAPSPNFNKGDSANLQDELLKALEDGDLEKFEELAGNKKINLNYKYGPPLHKEHFGNILEIACRRRKRGEFVRVLLQRKMKPNVRRLDPEPIHYAAKGGYDDSLKVLLSDKRTKVYLLTSKGQTALHLACSNFDAARADEYGRCIELLIPKMSDADLNKPDCNGFTAFHALVRGGDKKLPVRKKKPEPADATTRARETPEEGVGGIARQISVSEEAKAREQVVRSFIGLTRGALDVDSSRAKGRTAREDVNMRFPQLSELLPERRDQAPRADLYLGLLIALRNDNIDLFRALLQETDPDGNPTRDPNHVYGYPLHTSCLEMACQHNGGEEFVQALLEAGADSNIPNKLSAKYPIHMACERGHHRSLEALLEYSKVLVDVNCEDKYGNTPLHCTVDRISDDKRKEVGRRKCLEILLKLEPPLEVDISRINADGYCAFVMLLEDGNKAAIKTFMKIKWNLDFGSLNLKDVPDKPLRIAISEHFPELNLLLERRGTADTQRLRRDKSKKFFELLNPVREDEFVQQIKQTLANHNDKRNLGKHNDKKYTMLQRASRYGMVKAVKALLEANVDPNETFPGNQSPPGVIASTYRHKNVLEVLLEYPTFKVNATDSKGNTALHYATKFEDNLETVVLLLQNGARMSIENNAGKTPFGKEQVESLLDQCVKTNGKNAIDEDYELIFDYRLIAPGSIPESSFSCKYIQVNCGEGNGEVRISNFQSRSEKLGSEMDFLNMISKNPELSSLLDHPVILSFLRFKWIRLKHLSVWNLWVFIIFLISLNTFIILETEWSAQNLIGSENSSIINRVEAIVFAIITLIFWMFLATREFFQCILDPKKYFKSLENFLDWAVLISSLLSLFLPIAGITAEPVKIVHTLTILFSCFALLLLLGRVSKFAKYIEMLKVVVKNYILPLFSYSVILVAFGLSFHSLYYESQLKKNKENKEKIVELCNRTNITEITNLTNMANNNNTLYSVIIDKSSNSTDEGPFRNWYTSILMTIVMMIGEVDFKSVPDTSVQSTIVFIMFVLLVTVVLLNLLTGLAVSDTGKIEAAANLLRLQSRVGVVLRSERTLVNMYNYDCGALCCLRRYTRRALLFPDNGPGDRQSRVKTNVAGKVTLCGGDSQAGGGESLRMDREVERAKQIISQRGASPASRGLTLADVDAHVQEVLKVLKMLEVRCGMLAQSEGGREALPSRMSVFSESDD